MSYTLIKQAQARIALGKTVTVAEQVATILGNSSVELKKSLFVEAFDESAYQITPDDYSQWLETIVDIAAEQGVSIGRKNAFIQMAMDTVLDNDPKFDALGGDTEELKGRVAQTLWQTFKASKAHSAVTDNVNGVIKQAQEEEEAFAHMAAGSREGDKFFTHGQGVIAKISGREYPGMIVKRISSDEYEVRIKLPGRTVDTKVHYDDLAASEDEEQVNGFTQAFDAAKGIEDEQMSCPYPKGTLRAALWDKYNTPPKSIVKKVAIEDEQEVLDPTNVIPDEDEDLELDDDLSGDISLSASDLADRIVGDMDGIDFDQLVGAEDDNEGDEDLEARVAELEALVADLSAGNDVESDRGIPREGELDIDYDTLGNDRGGAANVIGVSIPATSKEEEEKGDMFRQAITAPREKLSQAVKSVEQEGATAWRNVNLPRNPHPKKSQAYRAWEKGMKSAAKDALGLKDKPAPLPNKQRRK